jgi:2-hydroxy-3-keto-5-methylthiopentenyl-1-phosphate phosphatase
MFEWWMAHYDLLKECGLTKDDIEKVINSDRIKLRDNFQEFFEILDQNNIPLTIMTSNGLGGDVIKMTLKRFNIKSDGIYLVANEII